MGRRALGWIAASFLTSALLARLGDAEPVEFAFPRHISDECDNLLVIGDVMLPLRRALSSARFRRFAAESRLAREMQLSQALTALEQNSGFVPTEIVIACPSSTYDQLNGVANATLLLSLCMGATTAGEEAVTQELPKLMPLVQEAVEKLHLPKFVVWLRFREPAVGQQAFAALSQFTPQLLGVPGLETNVESDRVQVKFQLADVVDPAMLPAAMVAAGLFPSVNDPQLAALSEALGRFAAEAWIERRDDGLRITVGPIRESNHQYPVESLGPLWNADDSLLAFGSWRITRLKWAFSDLETTWHDWRNTLSGKAVAGFDKEDFLGDLALLTARIEGAADEGAFQATAAESLEAVVHERGFKPAEPLTNSPLVNLLPRGAEIIDVDATSSLGDYIADALLAFEERLAKNSLRAEVRGDQRLIDLYDQVNQFYYSRLAEFRRFGRDRSRQEFAAPGAVLVGSQGRVNRMEISFHDALGAENHIALRDVPVMEFAAIGRVAGDERPPRFPNDFSRAFLAGFIDDVPAQLVERRDLGLGVETFTFRGDLWQRVPGEVGVTVDGDLLPHYFLVEDWLVFSTSLRLSASILAAHGNPGQRLTLPAGGGSLIAYGRVPAATVANYCDSLARLHADAATGRGAVELTGPTVAGAPLALLQRLADIFQGVAEAIRLFDGATWTTVDDGPLRETHLQVTMAPEPGQSP